MRFWGVIVILGSMMGLTGCWGGSTWHQKITVTVTTPNGEVSGFAVTKVVLRFAGDTWLTTGSQYQGNYSGEAVIVEIAPKKFIFALMDEGLITLALKVFIDPLAAASPKKEHADQVEAMRATKTLAAEDYPALVTFTDLNDPKSVKLLDPANLAATFGEGYELKSITLEITDDGVRKRSIEALLSWLGRPNIVFVDWQQYPPGHSLRELNFRSFSTEY